MGYKIDPKENGPLLAEYDDENVNLVDQNGHELRIEKSTYLCRCGHSKNKPFCDGAHVAAGFSSQKEITREVVQVYKGKNLTVNFNRSICAGAAACVHGLPDVFHSGSSTDWIYPDNAGNEVIIETIKRCPSGALSYSINGECFVDKRTASKISIVRNGPYIVEGRVELKGTEYPTNASPSKYTLCRCGYSKNKPFCDYSHAENNWSDE